MGRIFKQAQVSVLLRILIIFALLVSFLVITSSTQPIKASTCTQYYTVQWGDNLYQIGLRYGVTWQYLMQINNLWTTWVYPGQVLCVSTRYNPYPYPYCRWYYTVQYGDTLTGIGQRFGISWVYLWWINGLPNPNWILAGQVLCLAK